MRKVALLAALLIAAAFSSTSIAYAQKADPAVVTASNNTAKFLHDATFPYSVTAKAGGRPQGEEGKAEKAGNPTFFLFSTLARASFGCA